jgi:hypothetical protein
MSFLRSDVFANVKKIGITYSVVSEQETCLMADGQAYDIWQYLFPCTRMQGRLPFIALSFG